LQAFGVILELQLEIWWYNLLVLKNEIGT